MLPAQKIITAEKKQKDSMIQRIIVIALAISLLGAGLWVLVTRASHEGPPAAAPVRILFIGNSYTAVNDLPGMFSQLSGAGGHANETAVAEHGGWTLATHLAASRTQERLKRQKWDFVVLQEQSLIPASERARTQGMYPAVRGLVRQMENLGAKPILFLTWGRRDGWPDGEFQTYEAMQAQLTEGYMAIANELQVPVAPVGEAWQRARSSALPFDLWQADGSHPSVQGTYLAACVFYAVIFRQSPEGLTFYAGLSPETAQSLQNLAATIVLAEPKRWNLR
jgi:hypothetical protein